MCLWERISQYLCSVEPIQIAWAKGSFFNKQEIDKRFFLINKKSVNGFLHAVKKYIQIEIWYRMRKFDPFRFEIRPMFGNIAGHEDSEIALFNIGVLYSDFQ